MNSNARFHCCAFRFRCADVHADTFSSSGDEQGVGCALPERRARVVYCVRVPFTHLVRMRRDTCPRAG